MSAIVQVAKYFEVGFLVVSYEFPEGLASEGNCKN